LHDGRAIRLIDARTGETRDLVTGSKAGRLDRPHVSPDGRWLAFREVREAKNGTFVTRFTPDRTQSVEGLPAVQDPTTTGRPAGWSLDSRVLYLLLDTDGFRCLWGQRIDPGTGALVGQPFVVRHFHTAVGMSTSFDNTVTAEGFLYEASDTSANLWRLTRSQRPQP
jgi:hypothetical protein